MSQHERTPLAPPRSCARADGPLRALPAQGVDEVVARRAAWAAEALEAQAAALAAHAVADDAAAAADAYAAHAAALAAAALPAAAAAAGAVAAPDAAAAEAAAEAAPAGAAAAPRRHTGAAAPWLRAEDAALRAAVAAHGRAWTAIREAVEQDGAFPPLLSHLGAPESKCLRKRADKLAQWDAAGFVPAYRG